MEIGLLVIILIIIWLIWSRYYINSNIKKAFDLVTKDKPVSGTSLKETIRYCKSNKIECTLTTSPKGDKYLIVQYNEKVLTVQQKGNFRLGESLIYIQ